MKKKKPPNANNQNAELNQYQVKSQLDLSEIEELDLDIPLHIAAVRNNKIIKSKVVDLKELEGTTAEFDLEFQLPSRCGYLSLADRGNGRRGA